jgi:hypothetical protein
VVASPSVHRHWWFIIALTLLALFLIGVNVAGKI